MKLKYILPILIFVACGLAYAFQPEFPNIKGSKLTDTQYTFTCHKRQLTSYTCQQVSAQYGENTSFGVECVQDQNNKNRVQVDEAAEPKLTWTKDSLDKYIGNRVCSSKQD